VSSIPLKYKEQIVKQVNLEAIKNKERINEFATEVSSSYQVILNIRNKNKMPAKSPTPKQVSLELQKKAMEE
jgi:pyridoxal biosynthesis lyase PdxS